MYDPCGENILLPYSFNVNLFEQLNTKKNKCLRSTQCEIAIFKTYTCYNADFYEENNLWRSYNFLTIHYSSTSGQYMNKGDFHLEFMLHQFAHP